MDVLENKIILGTTEDRKPQAIDLKYANRHGLVAGATGTGKTVTLQIMAEQFSAAGVPVFMADVKGDLSGIAHQGEGQSFLIERAEKIGLTNYTPKQFPTVFWDVFGEKGHPIRTTVADMGPLLLSQFMNLSDAQTGVLTIAFSISKDQNLLLIDLDDLKSIFNLMIEDADKLSKEYGLITKGSVNTVLRKLIELENQNAELFFGEPAFDINDFIRQSMSGEGIVNILAADKLIQSPKLYSVFLLWLLSDLFKKLPEAGDSDKPKFVFFFDEAHLLFDDAPKVLKDKIERVVRLIRSKGVGIYFITQSPADIPEDVLGQLGNKVQHALRAFTPKAQKAVKVAAQSFRENPKLDTKKLLTELGVGQALVSTLQEKGTPSVVQHTWIRPPQSKLGPITVSEVQAIMGRSPVGSKYNTRIERESAQEIIKKRMEEKSQAQSQKDTSSNSERKSKGSGRQGIFEALGKSIARSVGSKLGREVIKAIVKAIKR